MDFSFTLSLFWVNAYLISGLVVAEVFKTLSYKAHGEASVARRFGPYLMIVLLWAIIIPSAILTIVFGLAPKTKS